MKRRRKKTGVLQAALLGEIAEASTTLWQRGWAEWNAGNLSCLVDAAEVKRCFHPARSGRSLPLGLAVPELAERFLLVTGTGTYFKNVGKDPESNLGLVQIARDGKSIAVLWGFVGGGAPTSELPSHLLGHRARLKADPAHRVIIHTHVTNLMAMSGIHRLDERAFTAALWKMCSECLVVFPDGVGIVPWMAPGTDALGLETAGKLERHRLVVWPLHGIVGAGRTVDEAMGLIETVEKSAELYLKTAAVRGRPRVISNAQLKALVERFQLRPKPGIIRGL